MFNIGDKVRFDSLKDKELYYAFKDDIFTVDDVTYITYDVIRVIISNNKDIKDLNLPSPHKYLTKVVDNDGNYTFSFY